MIYDQPQKILNNNNLIINYGKDANNYCDEKSMITEDSTLLDYLINFLFKAVLNLDNYDIQPDIQNQVIFDATHLTLDILKNALSNIDVRKDLFEKGRQSAIKFLDSLHSSI